ncbi:MAG: phage tail tape measure protein [Prevotella sp.]|nr:phage tail tape measure protein [Prevotella sp.]
MSVNVGSATGYLDLDISGFLASLQSAQAQANRQTKNLATTIGNNLSTAGDKLSSVGKTLTTHMTLPITGAGAAIVKLSADFESAMSKVSAISGATGGDLDALNTKAQEMGAKTKFSATEAAEAFTYMAMAGWKTEDMLQGIDGIMSLAAADGLDLATTSDIVTDALTAFGMGAEESGHFADVLAKASSNANTNVSMLGESFKYVAPVAGSLGYSAEDTAVALGLMANAGIKASQSGTALRASLTRMIKPTDDAAALMEEYNLSMTNSDGTMKSLGEVMEMLRANMGDLTEVEQAQAAATIFGQEAMSGMLAIINASDADFNKLTGAIYDAEGAANEMANTMLDNLSGQVTILKSALEGLALQFGEILLPYIKEGVTWIQNLTAKLQAMTPEQKEQVVKWAAIAAAIGPVSFAIGKLTSGVGALFTAFGQLSAGFQAVRAGGTAGAGALAKLGGAIAGITIPMVAVTAAIGVLIAAFVNLWKNNEEFRKKFTAIWNQIKETFETLVSGIVERLSLFSEDFEEASESLKAIWQGFCDFLAPVFEGAFQLVADVFKFITDSILSIFDFWIAVFKGDWGAAWNSIKNVFVNIWNLIKSTFENILNVLKGLLDAACSWFDTTWDETWTKIKTVFSDTWNNIKITISNAIKSIKTTMSDGLNAVFDVVKEIFNKIKNTISDTMNAAKGIVTSAIDKIKGAFSTVSSFVGGIVSGGATQTTQSSGVAWHANAMTNGMILNSPTIFGYDSSTGKLLGGGEVGSEVVVGTSSLMNMIRKSINDTISPMLNAVKDLAVASAELGYVTYEGFKKVKQKFDSEGSQSRSLSGGGDTFNFYSPKAIDEVEAARQMKKAKRDLAEEY